jgi:hypothetical protein
LNGGGVYMSNSRYDEGAARPYRVSLKEDAAGEDPAAEAMILSADDRPYR